MEKNEHPEYLRGFGAGLTHVMEVAQGCGCVSLLGWLSVEHARVTRMRIAAEPGGCTYRPTCPRPSTDCKTCPVPEASNA